MTDHLSREVHWRSRPSGWPALENFALAEQTVAPPAAGKVGKMLVRLA